jgi:hypothetical protein
MYDLIHDLSQALGAQELCYQLYESRVTWTANYSALEVIANQHVMISDQHVEAISTTKQEAKWKQSGSKQDAKWMQSGCKGEAKAWNMLEGMSLPLRHQCHWVANLRDYCHK